MANKSYTLIWFRTTTRRSGAIASRSPPPAGGRWASCCSPDWPSGPPLHYFLVAQDAAENRILREENLTLRSQLKTVRERIEHIGSTLDRVERFDQKLRAVTLLIDPQRNLAMGPTEPAPGASAPAARDRSSPSSPAGDRPRRWRAGWTG